MRSSRFTESQIVSILTEAALLPTPFFTLPIGYSQQCCTRGQPGVAFASPSSVGKMSKNRKGRIGHRHPSEKRHQKDVARPHAPPETRGHGGLNNVIFALSVLGIALTAYLTAGKWFGTAPLYCGNEWCVRPRSGTGEAILCSTRGPSGENRGEILRRLLVSALPGAERVVRSIGQTLALCRMQTWRPKRPGDCFVRGKENRKLPHLDHR